MKNLVSGTKGAVRCPHCGKGKVIVSENATGWTSQGCPKCGGFFVVDNDRMTARPAECVKGVHDMVIKN